MACGTPAGTGAGTGTGTGTGSGTGTGTGTGRSAAESAPASSSSSRTGSSSSGLAQTGIDARDVVLALFIPRSGNLGFLPSKIPVQPFHGLVHDTAVELLQTSAVARASRHEFLLHNGVGLVAVLLQRLDPLVLGARLPRLGRATAPVVHDRVLLLLVGDAALPRPGVAQGLLPLPLIRRKHLPVLGLPKHLLVATRHAHSLDQGLPEVPHQARVSQGTSLGLGHAV